MTKITLRVNGTESRDADIGYFNGDDKDHLTKWNKCVRSLHSPSTNPRRRDALLLARQAHARFESHRRNETYVSSLREMADHCQSNPNAQVCHFVTVKATWYPSLLIGLAHFRRNFHGSMVIDYVTAHPAIACPNQGEMDVRGIGTGLIYYIAKVAMQFECKRIWLEPTENSQAFYLKTFNLNVITDPVVLEVPKIEEWIRKYESTVAAATAKP